MTTINDPEFWREQWNALNAATGGFSGYRSAAMWDAMAPQYGRRHDDGAMDERCTATLNLLEKKGVVFEGAAVLDIGCGPGNYAAAFARRGARVVAVDISAAMLDRLRTETGSGVLRSVTTVQADWKTLDADAAGYAGAFDLVFANMTPAVATAGSFEKLMRVSRQWCWFRGWAGVRRNPLQEQLYRSVHGKEQRPFSGNFICAWNLVCALGRYPDCSFEPIGWSEKKTVDEWADFYALFFSGGIAEQQKAIRPLLEETLRETAVDESAENTVTGHTGGMLWSVEHRVSGT